MDAFGNFLEKLYFWVEACGEGMACGEVLSLLASCLLHPKVSVLGYGRDYAGGHRDERVPGTPISEKIDCYWKY